MTRAPSMILHHWWLGEALSADWYPPRGCCSPADPHGYLHGRHLTWTPEQSFTTVLRQILRDTAALKKQEYLHDRRLSWTPEPGVSRQAAYLDTRAVLDQWSAADPEGYLHGKRLNLNTRAVQWSPADLQGYLDDRHSTWTPEQSFTNGLPQIPKGLFTVSFLLQGYLHGRRVTWTPEQSFTNGLRHIRRGTFTAAFSYSM
jgi:hypothetical protein